MLKNYYVTSKSEESKQDFINRISDPIHLEIIKKPVLIKCGHTFEQKSANQINNCAICKKPFKQEEKIKNKLLHVIINSMMELNPTLKQSQYQTFYAKDIIEKAFASKENPNFEKLFWN